MKKKIAVATVGAVIICSLSGCGQKDHFGSGNGNGNKRGENDTQVDSSQVENHQVEATRDIQVGDYVIFGSYEQDNDPSSKEDIVWKVLAVDNGYATLATDKIIDATYYNASDANERALWDTCSLNEYENNEFFNEAFSGEEQAQMQKLTSDFTKMDNAGDGPEETYTSEAAYVSNLSHVNIGNYFKTPEENLILATPYALEKGAVTNQYWLTDSRGYNNNAFYTYCGNTERFYGDQVVGIRPIISVSNEYLGSKIVTDSVVAEKEEYMASTSPAFIYQYRWLLHQDFADGQLTSAPAPIPSLTNGDKSVTFPCSLSTFDAFNFYRLGGDNFERESALSMNVPAGGETYYSIDYDYADDKYGIYDLYVLNCSDTDMSVQDCISNNWFYLSCSSVSNSEYVREDMQNFLGFDSAKYEDASWNHSYSFYSRKMVMDYMMENYGNPTYVGMLGSIEYAFEGLEEGHIELDPAIATYFKSVMDYDSMGEIYVLAWEFDDYVIAIRTSDSYYGDWGQMIFQDVACYTPEMWQHMKETKPDLFPPNSREEIFMNSMNYVDVMNTAE